MRDLLREHRITARSIPEVVELMERTITHYATSRKVTFRGRKLSNEAFINATLLHLIDMEPADQRRALQAGMRRLEEILRAEPDAPAVSIDGAPTNNVSAESEFIDPAAKAARTPRRKA